MSETSEDRIVFAAEYALGTLERPERLEAEALASRHSEFADEVAFWQTSLDPMSGLVEPVAPPPALWSRLAIATGTGQAVPLPVRRGNARWKGTTVAALALAAAFAIVALMPRPPAPVPEPARFAAALTPPTTPARFLIETLPDGRLSVTDLATAPTGPGRAYQLWALPQGAAAPVSLGLLPRGPQTLGPTQRPLAQTQLLVSDEPAGGSPTDAPTGPVVFGGTLVPLSPAAALGR